MVALIVMHVTIMLMPFGMMELVNTQQNFVIAAENLQMDTVIVKAQF